MTTPVAVLLNLLGYVTGATHYAMLLGMLLWHASQLMWAGNQPNSQPDRLPFFTDVPGLAWNVGVLALLSLQQWQSWGAAGSQRVAPWLAAFSFSALRLLPAVLTNLPLVTVAHAAKTNLVLAQRSSA